MFPLKQAYVRKADACRYNHHHFFGFMLMICVCGGGVVSGDGVWCQVVVSGYSNMLLAAPAGGGAGVCVCRVTVCCVADCCDHVPAHRSINGQVTSQRVNNVGVTLNPDDL